MRNATPYIYILFALLLNLGSLAARGQTQDDFNTKMNEFYTNASDKKKALPLAKELYNLVEKSKGLQTYSNYYILKTIFENQAPDEKLAKTCADKATKAMNEMIGLPQAPPADTTSDNNKWYYILFPGLFSTKDPANAEKALQFINTHTGFRSFSNYIFVAYAFERNGDYANAKINYQAALQMK
ncbi:MAG TPA: hypothetical protein VLJ68_11500, partial [Chitinophagaceae bacterium]|nr:hypothetical protein [Chitinophagaceae bacterium]